MTVRRCLAAGSLFDLKVFQCESLRDAEELAEDFRSEGWHARVR